MSQDIDMQGSFISLLVNFNLYSNIGFLSIIIMTETIWWTCPLICFLLFIIQVCLNRPKAAVCSSALVHFGRKKISYITRTDQ